MKLIYATIFLLLAGIAAIITDCSSGNREVLECRVLGKHYQPPYTTTWSSTDEDGNVQIHTTDHPEQFNVLCISESKESINISTTATIYHTVTNQQFVLVHVRKGRWSGAYYLPEIKL